GEEDFRRQMVEGVLVSVQLVQAIEVILLHHRRRGFRCDDLLDEAHEVLNEVARRALDRLSSFDHRRAGPLAWLMGIAINVLRERWRGSSREARRQVTQSSCSAEQWQDILSRPSPEPHPATEPRPVRKALKRLSPQQQQIIRLRYEEERSIGVIAHLLRINEGAVRARLCRALKTLRRHLTDLEQRRNGQ